MSNSIAAFSGMSNNKDNNNYSFAYQPVPTQEQPQQAYQAPTNSNVIYPNPMYVNPNTVPVAPQMNTNQQSVPVAPQMNNNQQSIPVASPMNCSQSSIPESSPVQSSIPQYPNQFENQNQPNQIPNPETPVAPVNILNTFLSLSVCGWLPTICSYATIREMRSNDKLRHYIPIQNSWTLPVLSFAYMLLGNTNIIIIGLGLAAYNYFKDTNVPENAQAFINKYFILFALLWRLVLNKSYASLMLLSIIMMIVWSIISNSLRRVYTVTSNYNTPQIKQRIAANSSSLKEAIQITIVSLSTLVSNLILLLKNLVSKINSFLESLIMN